MRNFIVKSFLLLFLSFVIFAIALEIYNPIKSRFENVLTNTTIVYKNKFIPELPKNISIHYNNIGYIGEDYNDSIYRTKVIFVGSSTTQSVYVPFEDSWVAKLMKGKNMWYNNAGIDGAKIGQYCEIISQLKTTKPNYIVVLLNPFNPIAETSDNQPKKGRLSSFKNIQIIRSVVYPFYISLIKKEVGHSKVNWANLRNANSEDNVFVDFSLIKKDFFFDKLKRLESAIREINAVPVFISHPTPYGNYIEDSINIGIVSGGIDLYYANFNNILKEYCRLNHIRYIDGYILPKSTHYFYDFSHFNIWGSGKFSEFIKPQFDSALFTN